MTYLLFSNIPGQHPNYTVAVLAVGQKDAREYMRTSWGGGKLAGQVASGQVKADCGAVTGAAEAVIREKREQEEAEAQLWPAT